MRIIEKSNFPMQFMLWIFKDTLEIKFPKKFRLQKVKGRRSFFIRHTKEIYNEKKLPVVILTVVLCIALVSCAQTENIGFPFELSEVETIMMFHFVVPA